MSESGNTADCTGGLPDDALCLGCAYSLRGLPEHVCPECGRAFIPDDPKTYQVPDSRPRWPRIPSPPRLRETGLAIVVTVAYVGLSSVPGGLLASVGLCVVGLVPLGLAVLIVLAFDCVGRAVAVLADRERAAQDRINLPKSRHLRWVVLPLCLAVIASAHSTLWPLRARFHLSRTAFEEAVERIEAGADPLRVRGRFGLLRVSRAFRLDRGGSISFTTGMSGFDSVGVVYSPSDVAPSPSAPRLAPCWYADMY